LRVGWHRLGLYIFGRRPLLENTVELAPVVKHLLERPQELQLVLGEVYPTQRPNGTAKDTFAISDVVHMARFVKTMQEEQAKRMAAAMEAANEGGRLPLRANVQESAVAFTHGPSTVVLR